jgi:hypothetical protein
VEDAKRRLQSFWDRLFRGCHILVAVEKDTLYPDFIAPAKALGAKALYSGSGKSSKAAIEKVLRDCFNWSDTTWGQVFTEDEPLIVLHISDHDYDGEAVIGPTFAEQARRYTPYILEARVGIKPESILANGYTYDQRWYDCKIKDGGYIRWAEEKALFWAECDDCGHTWIAVGVHEHCPQCDGEAKEINVKEVTPHGFEVEALSTRDYRGLLVDALLSVLPWDTVISALRDECTADADAAASTIRDADVLAKNATYQALLAESERLNAIRAEFENKAHRALFELGQEHVGDFRDEGDDPDVDDFRTHVQSASDYASPWRPFDADSRTASLVAWIRENEPDSITALVETVIEW